MSTSAGAGGSDDIEARLRELQSMIEERDAKIRDMQQHAQDKLLTDLEIRKGVPASTMRSLSENSTMTMHRSLRSLREELERRLFTNEQLEAGPIDLFGGVRRASGVAWNADEWETSRAAWRWEEGEKQQVLDLLRVQDAEWSSDDERVRAIVASHLALKGVLERVFSKPDNRRNVFMWMSGREVYKSVLSVVAELVECIMPLEQTVVAGYMRELGPLADMASFVWLVRALGRDRVERCAVYPYWMIEYVASRNSAVTVTEALYNLCAGLVRECTLDAPIEAIPV